MQIEVLRKRVKEARALAHAVYDGYHTERQQLVEAAVEDLEYAGGVKSCIEGVVFKYGNEKYKFTGAYAAANQVIGVVRNGRGAIPPLNNQVLTEAEIQARYMALLNLQQLLRDCILDECIQRDTVKTFSPTCE